MYPNRKIKAKNEWPIKSRVKNEPADTTESGDIPSF